MPTNARRIAATVAGLVVIYAIPLSWAMIIEFLVLRRAPVFCGTSIGCWLDQYVLSSSWGGVAVAPLPCAVVLSLVAFPSEWSPQLAWAAAKVGIVISVIVFLIAMTMPDVTIPGGGADGANFVAFNSNFERIGTLIANVASVILQSRAVDRFVRLRNKDSGAT